MNTPLQMGTYTFSSAHRQIAARPDTIVVRDLNVSFCVGVTDAERARPQRLSISIEMEGDFSLAAHADDLTQTIDYYAVCQRLLQFGQGRSWKLIETLAVQIASVILDEFRPARVAVEVKKFIIAEASYVAVSVVRP